MIHDATIEVTCDGSHCGSSLEIQPEFRYADYSGKRGAYDTSDSALEEKIKDAGWQVLDGKHYCENCAEVKA